MTDPTGQDPADLGATGNSPATGNGPAPAGNGPAAPGADRDEQLVIAAFAAFRAERLGSFHPPPVDQVYAAATRHQRARRYRTGIAAAAALVLVLGTGALFTLVGSDQPRPSAGLGESASTTPDPSPPASLSPEPPTGGNHGGDTGKPTAGSGAVDVLDATIAMPELGGCPGGVLHFTDGVATDEGGFVWRLSADVMHKDLDGTAGVESITRVTAGGQSAVVAIRGTKASELKAMGYVVVPAQDETITWLAVSTDGTITVGIADPSSGDEQRRTYRWAASAEAFTQVGGPTGFPDPDPSGSDSPSPTPSDGG